MEEIVQLKIKIKWTKPPIWRRVLVPTSLTFDNLHHVIQICMGWENAHLYEFKIHNHRIGIPDEDSDFYDSNTLVDSTDVTLKQVLLEHNKSKFIYEYDFGDGWQHEITVEKFLEKNPKTTYPKCTKGKFNCPPEDCGGIGGYYHLLEILSDKSNPEYEDYIEWLGGEFDANYFNEKEINETLSYIDFN